MLQWCIYIFATKQESSKSNASVYCISSALIYCTCWDSIWNFALSAPALLKTYPRSITSSVKVIIMIYLTGTEMCGGSTCFHIKFGEDKEWFVCLFPLTWLPLHSNIDIDRWPISTESASTGIRIAGGGLLYAHFNKTEWEVIHCYKLDKRHGTSH